MADLKTTILDSDDLAMEQVTEWGQTFYIRELRGSEFQWIKELEAGSMRQMAACIVAGCVREDGSQIFERKDIDRICTKGFRKIADLATRIFKFNGLDDESDAEKNSEETPTD